jgi:hypothetical protein
MRRSLLLVLALTTLMFSATATSSSRNPVLGTWTATTTCSAQYKALMSWPGLRKYALEMVAGNGFIPGVQSPDQLKDRAHPCRGAVPRKHSHIFTKDGRFGSLDWNGQDVDDGTYTLKGANKIVIAKEFPPVTFTYKLQGKTIEFVPQIPKGCSTFRCAWSVSMAIPGTAWTRTAR